MDAHFNNVIELCQMCKRINYVLGVLLILVIALLFGAWYVYGKYKELKTNIVEPTEKVVAAVSNNVDQLNTLVRKYMQK
jgi:hypothetical protein